MGLFKKEEEERDQVQKDMSEDYSIKLSNILTLIDQYKQIRIGNGFAVVPLAERLHALFLKLSAKMTQDEIDAQYKFHHEINSIPIVSWKRRQKYGEYGPLVNERVIDNKFYPGYVALLEQREIHLNKIMERLGLTNVQKEKKRRIH